MKATQLLHNLGRSIWLNNITHVICLTVWYAYNAYIDELS